MKWHYLWLLIAFALVACGQPADTSIPNTAATQTRAAELTQVATLTAQDDDQAALPTAVKTPAPHRTKRAPTATRQPAQPTVVNTPVPAPTKPPSVVNLNVTAKGKDFAMTLHEVRDPVTAPETAFGPTPGNRWVAFDVTVQNLETTGFNIYSPHDAKLRTTDGRDYEKRFGPGDLEPEISGPVDAGQSMRGWITFEIPTDAQLASFTFEYRSGAEQGQVGFDLQGRQTPMVLPTPTPTVTPTPLPTATSTPWSYEVRYGKGFESRSFTVAGRGFRPGETLTYTIIDSAGRTVPVRGVTSQTVKVDRKGAFELTLTRELGGFGFDDWDINFERSNGTSVGGVTITQ